MGAVDGQEVRERLGVILGRFGYFRLGLVRLGFVWLLCGCWGRRGDPGELRR